MPLDPSTPSWLSGPEREYVSETGFSFSNDSGPGLIGQAMKKTAGSWEITHTNLGSTFVGSESVREMPELKWLISEAVERGEEYPLIEETLAKLNFQRHWIREAFFQVTGIDPMQAYFDFDNYSLPPGNVPRYNYGWGTSKSDKYDAYYILPVPDKRMGLIGIKGFENEIMDTFRTVTEVRDALKKLVKDVRQVTPQAASVEQLQIHPLYRAANLSDKGKELLDKVVFLKNAELSHLMLRDAIASDLISEEDYETLKIVADEPATMTGPEVATPDEQEQGKEFQQYRSEREQMSVEDVSERSKVPESLFEEKLETKRALDIPSITQDAFDVFKEATSLIQGYTFDVMSQDVDLMDVELLTPDQDAIDTGSVSFVARMRESASGKDFLGLVVMMIRNGNLSYSGRFKGENDREYGLNIMGVREYFEDMSGEKDLSLSHNPATDIIERSVESPLAGNPHTPTY